MNALLITVFTPLAGGLLLALVRRLSWAGWINVLVSGVTLLAAIVLAIDVAKAGVIAGWGFRIDAFNVYLLVLTALVGMTTSIFSRPYMQYVCSTGLTNALGMRLYHTMYQVFLFTMMLALSTDNLGILWKPSRRHGNILFCAAWVSRWPCSARCCCISRRNTWSPTLPAG